MASSIDFTWKIYEADDFGPALTPELRDAEERLRAQVEAKK